MIFEPLFLKYFIFIWYYIKIDSCSSLLTMLIISHSDPQIHGVMNEAEVGLYKFLGGETLACLSRFLFQVKPTSTKVQNMIHAKKRSGAPVIYMASMQTT